MESIEGDGRDLVGGQADRHRRADELIGQGRARHRAIVGRERHAHPGPMQQPDRMAREVWDDAGLDVRRRAQIERDLASAQELDEVWIVRRRHTVRHATDAEVEHLAHASCIGHLSGVRGQRQPAIPSRVEGRRVRGSRPCGLRSGQVEPDHRRAELGCDTGQLHVGSRRMLPHGGDDEADEGRGRSIGRGGARDARGDCLDHRRDGHPSLEMEPWSPADLGVSDSIEHEVLHELGGNSLERLGGLEQRDRQVEEGEQLGLVSAALGAYHSSPRIVERERHADRLRQLHRGRGAHRSVEVLVQLGLRKGTQCVDGKHEPMIGTRAAISVAVTLVGLVVLVGPRSADPGIGMEAERLVRERAQGATETLDALRAAIQPGLDAARAAAAAVLSADDPAGPALLEAGDTLADAESAATDVRRAVASLNGARDALQPETASLPDPIATGELSSIGAQLAAAAPAADAFLDLRRRGGGLPALLDDAFAALERGDPDAAADAVAAARSDLDLVSAWAAAPTSLPVWTETTDAMISAVEDIISATREGDAAAAMAAADAFSVLAQDAAAADRSLRIALAEGGSALTAAPLERLAAALGGIEGARLTTAAMAAEPSDR